jgi:amino acid transporter
MRAMDRRIGLGTATALVVASMIGTGVFTTTGFLVRDVGSPTAILFAWILGGVTAVCGALTYAELISALPTNGGEYALLGRMYHPALGFTAGFSSLVVGFAAPVAAASIAFGQYAAAVLPGLPPLLAAVGVLVLSSAFHAFHLAAGSRFQDVFTVGKVVLIVVFAGVGLALGEPSRAVAPAAVSFAEGTLSLPFAVGLIYVAFSYSGWNAAAYVAGEVESPERNLPRALILGTAIVTALYLALNVMFLGAAPLEALSGKVEIGHVAAEHLFGPAAARVVSAIIAVGLVSTIGAMVMTGARVAEALGRAHPRRARAGCALARDAHHLELRRPADLHRLHAHPRPGPHRGRPVRAALAGARARPPVPRHRLPPRAGRLRRPVGLDDDRRRHRAAGRRRLGRGHRRPRARGLGRGARTGAGGLTRTDVWTRRAGRARSRTWANAASLVPP